jgi:transcriptional regulator with XRE-family HTH domain
VDQVLERLKTEFTSEESRYAYADSAANAFLTGQIKALREDRGLTQEQLADLVGTQQSGISRWQNSGYSSCKVETLRKFAKAFGVRLRITFEEFGTLPEDVQGFTKKRLAPRRFEDDPAFEEPTEASIQKVARATGTGTLRQLANQKAGDVTDFSLVDYERFLKYYDPFGNSGLMTGLRGLERILGAGSATQPPVYSQPAPEETPDPYKGFRIVSRPKFTEAVNPPTEGKEAA